MRPIKKVLFYEGDGYWAVEFEDGEVGWAPSAMVAGLVDKDILNEVEKKDA